MNRNAGIDKKKRRSFSDQLEIRGDQIKIGISAPKDVPIYRKEVYLQIQQENEAAISADGLDALNNLLD